jgi:hypothetical protein
MQHKFIPPDIHRGFSQGLDVGAVGTLIHQDKLAPAKFNPTVLAGHLIGTNHQVIVRGTP